MCTLHVNLPLLVGGFSRADTSAGLRRHDAHCQRRDSRGPGSVSGRQRAAGGSAARAAIILWQLHCALHSDVGRFEASGPYALPQCQLFIAIIN